MVIDYVMQTATKNREYLGIIIPLKEVEDIQQRNLMAMERMLRRTLNVQCSQHVFNEELYSDLAKVSSVIIKRRRRQAGHCWRSNEAAAGRVLWKPKHGHRDLVEFEVNPNKNESLLIVSI